MPPIPDLTNIRALIVEDEFLVSQSLVHQLTELGCTVVGPATSVEAALALIDSNLIDVGLLNVHLDHDTSLAVARTLYGKSIPIVFVSAAHVHDLFPAEFASCPHIPKPIDRRSLERALHRALQSRRPPG